MNIKNKFINIMLIVFLGTTTLNAGWWTKIGKGLSWVGIVMTVAEYTFADDEVETSTDEVEIFTKDTYDEHTIKHYPHGIYKGELINNEPFGQGIITYTKNKDKWKKGDIYVGYFLNGRKHGSGTWIHEKTGKKEKCFFENGVRIN